MHELEEETSWSCRFWLFEVRQERQKRFQLRFPRKRSEHRPGKLQRRVFVRSIEPNSDSRPFFRTLKSKILTAIRHTPNPMRVRVVGR